MRRLNLYGVVLWFLTLFLSKSFSIIRLTHQLCMRLFLTNKLVSYSLRALFRVFVNNFLFYCNTPVFFNAAVNRLYSAYNITKIKLLRSVNNLDVDISSQNTHLLGSKFFGKAFFNIYLKYGFLQKSLFYFVKLFFHIYSFFFWKTKMRFDAMFFSPTVHGLFTSVMRNGTKMLVEFIFLSLFYNFKMFVGLSAILVVVGSILASKIILNRTHIFLSGRGYLVPTPSIFDKQYKSTIRNVRLFMRKRQYVRDLVKRSLFHGRYVGRRIPLYKSFSRLSSLFIKNQNFFVFTGQRRFGMRFVKNDVFNTVRKNLYLFILQRTYIQYR